MGQCASKRSGKPRINQPINRINEPINTQEDDHHYDDVNYDMMYDEIDESQIVNYAYTTSNPTMPSNNVPVPASSSSGHMSDVGYELPGRNLDMSCNILPVRASSGDGHINDESYDDAISCPRMHRVNSHTERGSMEASSGTYSQSSNTSLRSLVSVGKSYQMLCYDLETMVEIFRDEIEEDVDARRVVIYLTFLHTLSSGDLSCFQSSEERPARLKPKTQYPNTEEELQESLTDLQLWLEGLETNVGGHIGQREHSRGEEFENSQLNTTSCNLEQMANFRTIIEEKATEISNKCQQGLEQTLRKTLIPEFRSIMEETLSRYIESFRDEIRQEIRSVRDNISRESRSRAWIYRSSHYPVSSSGYVSENTSVYEPIKETDEEYSYTESKGIYENNLTKQ